MSSFTSPPELTYFDGPGRANLTRLAFKVGNIVFQDNRLSFEQWPQVKADSDSVPSKLFGSMPVIKHDDLLLAQSIATALYAAELGNLLGNSAQDRAVCAMIAATNEDLKGPMYKCMFGSEEGKAAGFAALQGAVAGLLAGLERALERKSTDGPFFLGGDAPSLADLAVFDSVCSPFPGLRALGVNLSAYPRVIACADAAGASPVVAAFVAGGFK
jgi:prostaglandin-H2 D-isomerase / glutathione transferase